MEECDAIPVYTGNIDGASFFAYSIGPEGSVGRLLRDLLFFMFPSYDYVVFGIDGEIVSTSSQGESFNLNSAGELVASEYFRDDIADIVSKIDLKIFSHEQALKLTQEKEKSSINLKKTKSLPRHKKT